MTNGGFWGASNFFFIFYVSSFGRVTSGAICLSERTSFHIFFSVHREGVVIQFWDKERKKIIMRSPIRAVTQKPKPSGGGRVRRQPYKLFQFMYQDKKEDLYNKNTKYFVWICAVIMPLAYAIGLLFTLRTHQSQIYQETQNGHDAPNWSKKKSFTVLMVCTVMFSLIAENLIHSLDDSID